VKAGWGRIHVKRIPAEKALSTKSCLSYSKRLDLADEIYFDRLADSNGD